MQTASESDQTRCGHSRVKLTVLTLVKAQRIVSELAADSAFLVPAERASQLPIVRPGVDGCRPSDISYAVVSDEVKTAIDKP